MYWVLVIYIYIGLWVAELATRRLENMQIYPPTILSGLVAYIHVIFIWPKFIVMAFKNNDS
jgi:hypothetical protein